MSVFRTIGVLVVGAACVASLPAAAADGFDPASTSVTVIPGGSATLEQTLHLDALPQKADVVIAIDTTGSMGEAIADAKADATDIVTGVQASIPGTRFAVVDFRDYAFSPYGIAGTDYPYLLRTPLTSSAAEVQAAINPMGTGFGLDTPESHNRAFFETYSDPAFTTGATAFDPQATRIMIMLTDAIPHDPAQASRFPACRNTGGPGEGTVDPGRNGTPGDGDDLGTGAVIDGLIASGTTLSVITYPTSEGEPGAPACMKALAAATGGSQVERGGTDSLLELIKQIVTQHARRIEDITFRVEKPSGWTVSFTPPNGLEQSYGPFTAPRDIPFEETITVPPGTPAGTTGTVTVTAIVDGAERGTHSVDVTVSNQAVSQLTLDVDRRSIPAGISSFSPSVVPAARIPFFGGASTASAPVGSIPVGSVPVGSIPVGSVPVGSIPVGSVPVGSIPVGSIPVGSIGLLSLPVGSIPVGSIPVGSIPVGSIGLDGILLSSLPLAPDSGTTWAEILDGTDLARRPLQTLTLLDVARNQTAGDRFNDLELKDVPFLSALLRDVKLASVLLGTATLDDIPPPGGAISWETWLVDNGGKSTGVDETTNTVLGLDLAGRLGSTPVGSIPVGSVPVGSVPVGSIPVGSIDLLRTRLAGVPVSTLGASLPAVVDCGGGYCTAQRTLGQAQADNRILSTATIADLDPVLDTIGLTMAELIAALIGLESYPWHLVPLVGLQDVAGNGERARYTAQLDLNCAISPSVSSMRLNLPPGFVPVAGTARWRFGTGPVQTGTDAVKERLRFRWTAPTNTCASGTRHVTFEVDTFAGLELGEFTADAIATAGASFSADDQAPILVVQNHEPNDVESSPTAAEKNKVYAFHVAAAGDKEIFTLPIPARNTRTRISLNVPDDADLDLVVGRPSAVPLNSAPVGSVPVGSVPVGSVPVGSVPVGSVPLPDEGATANDSERAPQPDTLQDIPVGSVPVGSVSAGRGSADEAVHLVSDGTAGAYTVVVSGYNGSRSDQVVSLHISEAAPPPLPACDPRTFTNPSSMFGTLPGSVPAGTKTLFLVNRNQMARLHGEQAVQDLLDYIGTAQTPGTLAGRPEVLGTVLEVDGAAAVQTAYAAWNASPCSIEAVNAVVRANNDVVGSYLEAQPGLRQTLKYIVVLGSDEVVPAGRVPDPVLISPELDNAGDLAFTTADLTNGNALYGAAASNHMTTDAVYGSFTTIPWLGRQLNLPNLPVSRLLESPAEIEGQLAQYESAQGLLQPTTAYVTGYDFLSDGAADVSDGLAGALGLTPVTQINGDWTKQTVQDEFFGAATIPDIGVLNAHYNHYLAQPAAATTAADLFSTSVVPSLPGRVLFTMGCHAGLNVADTLLAGTLPPDALDWAQAYARAQVGLYVANYTFGYGDTEASALSERLMALFAARLGADNRSLAEQWVESLHTYFATAGTAYGVYDEKALIGANLMGPPWYRVGGAPAPTTPPTTPTTTAGDGLIVAARTVTPTATQVGDGSGGGPTYWSGESVLSTHYRPLQPVVTELLSPPAGTPHARGIFITALETQDVSDVKPVLARPTVDLGAHELPPTFDETFFPANYVLLARTGTQTRAVISAGQFRPTPGSDRGTQRLVDSISYEVAFDADEAEAPRITEVGALQLTAGTIRIYVRGSDASGIRRAAALVNDGTSGSWQFVSLSSAGGGLFTADVTASMNAEIIAQLQNVHGYTAYSTKKGENFNPVVNPPDPDFVVDLPRSGDVYLLNQVVVPSYLCSGAGIVSCSGPAAVDTSTVGSHTYTVTATDIFGGTTEYDVAYEVWYAFDGFKQPVDNRLLNVAKAGSTIPLKWQLRDAAGVIQSDLNTFTSLTTSQIACPNALPDPLPPETTTSVSGLRYDAATQQFVFNVTTLKSWRGTCRTVYLQLADGSTPYTAVFSFK